MVEHIRKSAERVNWRELLWKLVDQVDRMPILLNALEVCRRGGCYPGQFAIIMQVRQLNAAPNRIGSRSSDKRLIVLAIALRHRIQSLNNLIGKTFTTQPMQRPSWAILADIVQH